MKIMNLWLIGEEDEREDSIDGVKIEGGSRDRRFCYVDESGEGFVIDFLFCYEVSSQFFFQDFSVMASCNWFCYGKRLFPKFCCVLILIF